MDYGKQYNMLINRAKNRTIDGYKESHHIMPRCLGGSDEKDNLVDLTAREHFIAHLLLWKMYPESYGLIKAINMMCCHNSTQEHRSMNRMYGWLKEYFSDTMSSAQSGNKNSQFGTIWIHNKELKISKKIAKNSVIEDGWEIGRIIKFDKSPKMPSAKKEKIKKEKIAEKKIEQKMLETKLETITFFKQYLDSDYSSLNQFVTNELDISLVAFTNRLKRYLDGYTEISKQGGQNLKEMFRNIVL